jgi:glycosyltransferase involved in cell wall biosynthesis
VTPSRVPIVDLISVGGHRWAVPPARQEVDFPVAKGLAARLGGDHHVIVRAEFGGARAESDGRVIVHYLPADASTWSFARRASRRVRQLTRSAGAPTVLLTSDVAGALAALRAGSIAAVPLIVQVQGGVLDPGGEYGSRLKRMLIRAAMRTAVRRADAVRALNGRIADEAREAGARGRVEVIGSRVDGDQFAFRTPDPVGARDLRIGAVGALAAVKNHDVLLAAFAQLIAEYPDAALVLVGDGPRRAELERQTRALGVESRVSFVGTIPHRAMPELLRSLSIFVQASFSEGEPRAVLEAQAVGVPVVVSDIPAHRGIVADGLTGLVVSAHDPSEWVNAWRRVLDDATLYRKLAVAAGEQVRRERGFEVLLDRFADFIRSTSSHALRSS